MKLSLIQMRALRTPEDNLIKIKSLIRQAAEQGAEMVVLPEMCCCEYSNAAFTANAMPEGCDFLTELANQARENKIVLVAGSVPEACGDKLYNTSYVFDECARVIAKHRKVHLFDIDVKGKISFRESSTFSAGDGFTVFDTKWGKMGLIICFDIRFPEFIKQSSSELKMIIVPASFNMTTGPAHWELLFRARAVDNQVFMAGCAAATDENSTYHSYGHSIVTSPWGDVVAQLGTDEEILTCDVDFNKVDDIRGQIPLYR